MQSKMATNLPERVIGLPFVNMKNILVVLSGICLFAMFFTSYVRQPSRTATSNSSYFQSSPNDNKPVANGVAAATSTTSVSQIVTDALAFKAMLTSTQQAALEQTYTTTLARTWSNLPCGSTCRNGIQFSSLTSTQLTAALSVIQSALSSSSNNGYEEFAAIRIAEEILQATAGGDSYDEGNYWISFLNTPTATGTWMLQFGGHHFASNIAFNNGHVIGATPYFMGVEPATYTYNNTTYAPLDDERTAFRNMLASLSSTQLATAKLSTSFSDCLMSPGESNGNTNTMPSTKQGLICSELTTTQKNLVIAAMQNYVDDMDATTAASVMSLYTSEIDQTYVAFTGSATVGSASTFLNSSTNYVRIDGPHVWIEFVCQNGVVFPSQIHFHTVWRDHESDYGVDLTGAAIDATSTTGVAQVTTNKTLAIYPNPADNQVSFSLGTSVTNASVIIVNVASGQLVRDITNFNGQNYNIDISTLPAGSYVLKVQENGGSVYVGKFIKK